MNCRVLNSTNKAVLITSIGIGLLTSYDGTSASHLATSRRERRLS